MPPINLNATYSSSGLGGGGGFINYEPSYTRTTITYADENVAVAAVNPSGKSMNTRTETVHTMAGYLGQVVTSDPYSMARIVLWESKPKKTLAKADKAAKKAQLRAAQRSFE